VIDIHGDLEAMTLDELVGQLQVAEDADAEDEPVAKGATGELLLTKGQWEARSRQCGGGGHDDGGGGGDDDSSTSSGHIRSHYRGKCFNCGVRGAGLPEEEEGEGVLADIEEEATLL
jgi:hypothetical protein